MFWLLFLCKNPCIFQTTSAKTVGFHTWWSRVGPKQPKRMKLQGCVLRKSKIYVVNTWIQLEPDCAQRKFHPNPRNPLFLLWGWVTPGRACPKAVEMSRTSLLEEQLWLCWDRFWPCDLQQPLLCPHLLTQGCSYTRLFHNFPTFTSPTCPQPCRLSVCSRLCLAGLELHLNPNPCPFAETATNI